jgi:hypothetical protein
LLGRTPLSPIAVARLVDVAIRRQRGCGMSANHVCTRDSN